MYHQIFLIHAIVTYKVKLSVHVFHDPRWRNKILIAYMWHVFDCYTMSI